MASPEYLRTFPGVEMETSGAKRGPVAVGVAVAIGLVHALVVAPRYHVGSFDDDGSYVLAARALAVGHGITSRAAGGYPLVGVYPPGYPALLSPLAAIWPSGVLAFRVLSLVLFVTIFPLTWIYLGRRGVAERMRFAVLALLALNPVLATYATMVMPEIAFVVVLLLMLLALDRWEAARPTITWAGIAAVVSAASLLWLKEAGLGVVVGVVAWLLLRRLYRKALLAAMAPAVLLLPLLIMRNLAGANLIGSRYSSDLGGVFKGGLVARILHVVPDAAWTYVEDAVPHTLVPTSKGFLPSDGSIGRVMLIVIWTAAPLVVIGFISWWRRHPDAACLAVPAYLAETLIYPFTNERRVVLVLPVIVAWYVLGAGSVFSLVRRAAHCSGGRVASGLGMAIPVVASLLVLATLVSQFTRDYMFFEGADSSSPGGSPYMSLLRQLGSPHDVVETDYLWTTALYSGRRTANGAYLAGCDPAAVADAIRSDAAGYLLTASLNGGGLVDGGCLLPVVSGLPEAVRLYRSSRDQASVFELVGPGTGNPGLRDLVTDAEVVGTPSPPIAVNEQPQISGDAAGMYWTLPVAGAAASVTWSWEASVAVSQISLGAAGAGTSSTTSVEVSVRSPDGTWRVVASESGAVGADTRNHFVLVRFPQPTNVGAVRVTVGVGAGESAGAAGIAIHDVHVLGNMS